MFEKKRASTNLHLLALKKRVGNDPAMFFATNVESQESSSFEHFNRTYRYTTDPRHSTSSISGYQR